MSFYNWAMANGYAEDLTIDRIDVNGDYKPSNCRWVTFKVQCNNRRNNHFITYNGKTHTIVQWAEILGIKDKILYSRINKWDIEKAFTMPVRKKNNTIRT